MLPTWYNRYKNKNNRMKFSEVVGQQKLKDKLTDNVNHGRIAHAQIFHGNSGNGSLALAIAYAQYILCENKTDNDSCGLCPSCVKIATLTHPDLHFSFPVNKSKFCDITSSDGDIISDSLISKWRETILNSSPVGYFSERDWYNNIELTKNAQGNIGKPEATEIIKKMAYKSFLGGYKIVIMWLVERMNETAANALLKLFEEPAEKTLFIFIAETKDTILKTILSRAQLTTIPPIDIKSVNNYVDNKFGINEKNNVIARISQGNILKTNELLNNVIDKDDNFELFTTLMRRCFFVDYLGLIEWAEGASLMGRESQKEFFEYSLKILRDSYMLSIGMGIISYTYGSEYDFIKKFAPYVHYKNIESLIKEFEKAFYDLSRNGNNKIIFTHFVLAISKLIKRI